MAAARPSLNLKSIALRLQSLVYEAPIDCPARATFIWRGRVARIFSAAPNAAAVELQLGFIPFSIENRGLRASIIGLLEAAAAKLRLGVRIGQDGSLWVCAACQNDGTITYNRLMQLTALNIMCLDVVVRSVADLMVPIDLDQPGIAA